MKLPQVHKIAGQFVTENASSILTGVGVVGTVATAVLTGRAAIKAHVILEDLARERRARAFADEGNDPSVGEMAELGKIDNLTMARYVWQEFVPPVLVGSATIGAIVMANRMSAQRAAALAAAYGISEQRLSEYKAKVLEKVGVNKEQAIRDEVAQDRVNKDETSQMVILADGDVLCYDMLTGRYFKSSVEKIRKAENTVNHELMFHESCSLSRFFDEIGLPPTSYTDEVGWNQATDGVLEVQFSTTRSPDDRPCIAVDFSTAPHPAYHNQW